MAKQWTIWANGFGEINTYYLDNYDAVLRVVEAELYDGYFDLDDIMIEEVGTMSKVVGDKLTYILDGSTVEITCLSEHDLDGVYVRPAFTSGREFYTSLKLLEVTA